MKRASAAGLLLAALLAALTVSPASAGSCGITVRKTVVVERAAVVQYHQAVELVTPVVAVYQQPYAYYGAYYTPPPAAPTDDLAAAVKALAAEVRALKDAARPVMPPAPGDVPTPRPVDPFNPPAKATQQEDRLTTIMRANCGSCHSDGAVKGGGLALFKSGAIVPFTPETLRDTIDTVSTGKMPRGSKLADGAKLELIRLAVGGK